MLKQQLGNILIGSVGLIMGWLQAGCLAQGEMEPSTCNANAQHYTIRRAVLPRNFINADKWGFDFNRDGKLDNALGNAAVTVSQFVHEFNPEPQTSERLAHDAWRLIVYRCSDRTRARLSFVSAAGQQSVLATMIGDSLQSDPDASDVAVPLTWLADAMGTAKDAGWLTSFRVALNLRSSANSLAGRLTVALEPGDARAAMLVPLADFFTYAPTAKLARQALDQNRDGSVTANELAQSGSFQQLTSPDLTSGVLGVDQPTVSLGINIEAERVP